MHDLQPSPQGPHKIKEKLRVSDLSLLLGWGKLWIWMISKFGLKTNWGLWNMIFAPPTYNDAMIESFSERNPGVHFGHIHPGLVNTPMYARNYII